MSVNFLSNEFVNLVAPYAPGAGNLMIVQELRLAARRFLKETRMLWLDVGPHSFNALEATYQPVLPTGTSICGAESMRWLGSPIHKTNRETLNQMATDWTESHATSPSNYLFDDEATLRVYPKPTDAVADALKGRLFLMPSMASTAVDDRIFEHYSPAIAAGALHEMLMMIGKPWSNAERAKYYGNLYAELKGDARIAKSTDFTHVELRVSMRPMA